MSKRGGSRGRVKPSLKSLNLSRVEADAFHELLEEINQGSDRSAAILATSLLHSELAHTIIQLLDPNRERTERTTLLFERDAPVSSLFSATILGYAMGLFGDTTYQDIGTIRRVRNAFAHFPHGISFGHELVSAECTKLKWKPRRGSILVEATNLRDKFTFTALGITFELRARTRGKKPPA